MTKCLAFHSYKGGTGKSTISFNLSAQMVKRGLKVLLLDLDVYAPSLQTYLDIRPDHWINDFLFEDVKLNQVVTDLTHVKIRSGQSQRFREGKITCRFFQRIHCIHCIHCYLQEYCSYHYQLGFQLQNS